MQPQFQPLEADTRWKNLVYLSEAKLDQFCLSTEKRGWNFNFKIGGGVSARKKSPRERLGEVDRLLQSQSLIHYEKEPEPRAYFLVRLMASAGTYWPWAGNQEAMKHIAWWVGQGEHVDVLAYGHIKNVLQQGTMPDFSFKSTWWPSRSDTYKRLTQSMVIASDSEDELPVVPTNGEKVRRFMETCFHDGVRRNYYIETPAVFEMLLRVDGREDEKDKCPVVFGSPVWVARIPYTVPGIYRLGQEYSLPNGQFGEAFGIWEGRRWTEAFWEAQSLNPRGVDATPVQPPKIPAGPPVIQDLVSLRIPQSSASIVRSEKETETAHSLWKRFSQWFS